MWALAAFLSVANASEEVTKISADRLILGEGEVSAEGGVGIEHSIGGITADRLVLETVENGSVLFSAEGVRWTPCECERPPWAISAKSGEGQIDERVVLRGAAVEVCGIPLIPVPWASIPLRERVAKVLFPEIGYGDYGPRVGLPVWFPVAERSGLTITPEYRSEQAFQQRVELSGPAGRADIALADEIGPQALRGQGGLIGGMDDGSYRLAIDSRWVSDSDVQSDYGNDFVSRSSPYAESLIVAAAGPVRLESNTFDRGAAQRPLGAVLSVAGDNLGPVAVHAESRLDWVELGDSQDDVQRAGTFMSLVSGHSFGVVETRAGALAEGAQWSDGGPWAQGQLFSSVYVPMWGKIGKAVHIAELGMHGDVARHSGAIEDRFGWMHEEPRWSYGPALRSTFVAKSGVPISSEMRLRRTVLGWEPVFTGQLNRKDVHGWVQADKELQAGRIGVSTDRVWTGVGLVHGAGLLQSFADLSVLTLQGLRPGWSGLYSHPDQTWIRQGPQLKWDSKCDCLSLDLRVEWTEDRDFPDAAMRLDLRPRRAKDRQE